MPTPLPRLGGPMLDVGVNAAGSDGVAVVGSATPNTKGSWTELIASTTQDAAWLSVQIMTGTGAAECLIDIGIGAAAAEIVLVPDLACSTEATGAYFVFTYLLPTNIPAGSRIAARAQSDTASAQCRVAVQLVTAGASGIGGLGRHEAAGVVAADSGLTNIAVGGVAHTDTAFSAGELIASTSFDYRWLNIAIAHQKNSAASAFSWLVDIGVGASGSESVVVSDILAWCSTASDMGATTICLPVSIAAGQRIAARARCSGTQATDREIRVAVWGSG